MSAFQIPNYQLQLGAFGNGGVPTGYNGSMMLANLLPYSGGMGGMGMGYPSFKFDLSGAAGADAAKEYIGKMDGWMNKMDAQYTEAVGHMEKMNWASFGLGAAQWVAGTILGGVSLANQKSEFDAALASEEKVAMRQIVAQETIADTQKGMAENQIRLARDLADIQAKVEKYRIKYAYKESVENTKTQASYRYFNGSPAVESYMFS